MPRYSTGVRTAAGSTILPIISLYAIAAVGGAIREIGVFNTTTTAVALRLIRLVATGTQGTGLVEAKHDTTSAAASCTAFTTHTGDPTASSVDLGYYTVLGAAAGAGVIWTFGASGLLIPVGTAQGIGVIPSTGTGQICDAYIVWDE
jgi:hypothetical protein